MVSKCPRSEGTGEGITHRFHQANPSMRRLEGQIKGVSEASLGSKIGAACGAGPNSTRNGS
jgi:hypothetical protein